MDRRFKAYSEFIIHHRSVQNALQFYYSQAGGRPGLSDINALLRSARDSAPMVFLVAETERTYEACRGVLRALEQAHSIAHENTGDSGVDSGREINIALGKAMREFQNAARAELEVNGPEWQWVPRRSANPDAGTL